MSEIISIDEPKTKIKRNFSLKLRPSLDNSNESQNDEEICFSSKCLFVHSNYITKTDSNQRKNKNLFDSMDIDMKKKLFSSDNEHKSYNKKNSEAKSTEPTSIRVKNFHSPRKRFSVFKLVEKEKKSKKDVLFFLRKTEEKEEIPQKNERTDIYGNVISKKNKKNVKVSFIDKVTNQPLANIVEIECFKNYNYVYGIPKEEKIDKASRCQCCAIF